MHQFTKMLHYNLNGLLVGLDYTEFHFQSEEKNMECFDYPGKAAHLEKHAEFKKMVRTMSDDFEEDGSTEELARALDTYLTNWLVEHIKGVDVEFGKFLNENEFTCMI